MCSLSPQRVRLSVDPVSLPGVMESRHSTDGCGSPIQPRSALIASSPFQPASSVLISWSRPDFRLAFGAPSGRTTVRPAGRIDWLVNLVVRHALLQLPSLPLGGARARTGRCRPLPHPSHPANVGLACRPVGAWRRQLVKQLDSTRVDPGTQLAERGVGVDGHHPVILADLREDRPCAGRDGGFADPGRRGGGHGP